MTNSDAVVENRSAIPIWIPLGGILLLFAAMSGVGITWGLPSRNIDKYLFGDGEVWPGEKIYRLEKADEKFSPTRGADVDVDPIRKGGDEPIPLTATDEDVAKIYLRYRLYTYQPDEMITMMALAGMRPGKLDFDPRLYQYGGLFIYPVGALIKLCGLVGLIDVRSDVVFYLDNPDEFGKFYIVARAYSAAWGLIGVIIVYAIAKRIANHRAGLLAALLFTLMPVVVCMAHEGKPHLPGAVLMLLAVYFAMRCSQSETAKIEVQSSKFEEAKNDLPNDIRHSTSDFRHSFWWMCLCCGAALGMVLSSWPIFVLIPLVSLQSAQMNRRFGSAVKRTMVGVAVALGVYFITNPYIVINAFVNREVLKSNFGNSLAMYEIARIGEGFVRTLQLTIEGATLPILAVGMIAFVVAIIRKNSKAIPLVVVALVFFLQFVLIGAGKPAEYGRFGIFTNTALAIGAGLVLGARWGRARLLLGCVLPIVVISIVGVFGAAYLLNFRADAKGEGSRVQLAQVAIRLGPESPGNVAAKIGTLSEPAPYCFPPMNFARMEVVLYPSRDRFAAENEDRKAYLVDAVDRRAWFPSGCIPEYEERPEFGSTVGRRMSPWRLRDTTPISRANKPFETRTARQIRCGVSFGGVAPPCPPRPMDR